ncbi:MAG: HIT family protein [Patescibacteria group bacterium]|nr:HIT family protein [Patescibacteria group bacterium]
MHKSCGICSWIKELPTSPFLIKEFSSGYAVISKYQYYKGYTLFLYKEHVIELHELSAKRRNIFLDEMSQVAKAVYHVVRPDKLNYELLGNTEPHMHWHIIPRYKTEKEFQRPIWIVNKNVRQSEDTYPSVTEVKRLKEKILQNFK